MKKKKVSGAARHGSKRVKGISREVRVLDPQAAYGISLNALSTLMVMANPHKNAHLFYEVCNSRLQGEIVDALGLYHAGEAYTIHLHRAHRRTASKPIPANRQVIRRA